MDRGACAVDLDPVAFFEVADAVGKRRESKRVGAQEHLALAVAQRQRAAVAGADHQIVMAGKQNGEREGAAQPLERFGYCLLRRQPLAQMLADEVDDDFRVGFGRKDAAGARELAPQVLEVLDDAVVDEHHALIGVRVGVDLGRRSVRRPAGVADADPAGSWILGKHGLEVDEFARGATADDRAVRQRGNPGRVVAAILQPAQAFNQQWLNVCFADNSDDAAHGLAIPLLSLFLALLFVLTGAKRLSPALSLQVRPAR
ncbi:hypothetical protein DF3PA_170022 [Candidatus Defluviicoccus seviourii]|uniref:Uncharacterized protein n=1 Tax=Candidatus Defluviicoccus seviourii TaxID=2565273 RepID=A0A564WCA8_9PROT|nr:hypothetical protein DF3PA_170022 [Candidatus Defluviicoccus seviourii]